MKREAEDYARLVSELESDLADLERVAAVNERAAGRHAAGARDELDLMAWAMSLHNLYGVMESYALRIAKFFENGLDPVSWHRSLMERMCLEISGLRPSFLSREELAPLDELRSFRHLVRHLYARPLDEERLALVQRRVAPALLSWRAAHRRFVAAMRELAAAL